MVINGGFWNHLQMICHSFGETSETRFGIWNAMECNQWKNSPPVSFISFISDFLDGIYAPQSGDLKIASPENVFVGDYGISLYPFLVEVGHLQTLRNQ